MDIVRRNLTLDKWWANHCPPDETRDEPKFSSALKKFSNWIGG